MLDKKNKIKEWAKTLGFYDCRVAQAGFLEKEAPLLEKWLKNGHHGNMSYMENHFDKRLDPTKLVPGAKSLVTLSYVYTPESTAPKSTSKYKIAKYAYGRDYHKVIRKKLKKLLEKMQENFGAIEGRGFVDSAPIMERQWAEKSGLGWIGKNSLLLSRSAGSFFFLAQLIIDLPLEPDPPVKDFCGTCTKCMDACPTAAIPKAGMVDGSRCISYLTIELKDQIPQEFEGKYDNWIFGCDICQDVCPWNRFAKPHQEPDFNPKPLFDQLDDHQLEDISEELFDQVFMGSAIKRTGYRGIKRNIEFLKK